MDRKRTRVGFVCLGGAGVPGSDRARRLAQQSQKYMQKRQPFELVAVEDVVVSRQAACAAGELFRRSNIDALIIQHGAFTPDALTLELVTGLGVPVAVWGIPEGPFDGVARWSGSMAGLLMHTSALTHRSRRFSVIFGEPDQPEARKALDGFLNAAAVWRTLRACTIGLLSHGGPGFHTAGIDSFALKDTFGPEVLYVDPAELAGRFDQISDADGEHDIAACLADGWSDDVNDAHLLNDCARSYLAICGLQAEHRLDAISTHRPGPGLPPAESGIGLAHSRLTDQGVMTNTDDDLGGLLTMLIEHLFTGRAACCMEWMHLDEWNNQVLFWNGCGAPVSMCNPRVPPALRRIYSGQDCVAVEFPLKAGEVTFARLLGHRGRFKLLVVRGRALEDNVPVRGACVNVKFECSVNKLLNTILENGFPHRYALVYQDITAELSELAGMLGVEVITV